MDNRAAERCVCLSRGSMPRGVDPLTNGNGFANDGLGFGNLSVE